MNKYDSLRKKMDVATAKVNTGTAKLTAVNTEMRRVAEVAHNAKTIIDDIDAQFARATQLNKTDITFLFVATALQCTRWMLLPSLDLNFKQTPPNERLSSQQGANRYEKPQQKAFLKDHEQDAIISSALCFFGWNEIIGAPVPYDAMKGSEHFNVSGDFSPIGTRLYGKNHHVATLGHDPLLGWVFGTMDIMTRTATMKDFKCYRVEMVDRTLLDGSLSLFEHTDQYFTNPPVPIPLRNCSTNRKSGKIIKTYASYYGLFNKLQSEVAVYIERCRGLDSVKQNGKGVCSNPDVLDSIKKSKISIGATASFAAVSAIGGPVGLAVASGVSAYMRKQRNKEEEKNQKAQSE